MFTLRKFVTAALMLGAAITLQPLTADAAPGNAQIGGVARFDADGCTELPPIFPPLRMTGSLDGCWYTTSFTGKGTPSGTWVETGTEEFRGCLTTALARTCGSFTTTYRFEAKFSPTGQEIFGRCQHPIVGGTGGFAGISGRVDFKDDVVNGCFYYRGHISLG